VFSNLKYNKSMLLGVYSNIFNLSTEICLIKILFSSRWEIYSLEAAANNSSVVVAGSVIPETARVR
jgi:hypothetical protein